MYPIHQVSKPTQIHATLLNLHCYTTPLTFTCMKKFHTYYITAWTVGSGSLSGWVQIEPCDTCLHMPAFLYSPFHETVARKSSEYLKKLYFLIQIGVLQVWPWNQLIRQKMNILEVLSQNFNLISTQMSSSCKEWKLGSLPDFVAWARKGVVK